MIIHIISGFLGSGKTTLIKKSLEEDAKEEKTVIIENELGEVGIDGELLRGSGLEVKEIYSGCICCTLQGDLTKALEEVHARFAPERVFIEPSGVAKLSIILKDLEGFALGEIGQVITVVDPIRFDMYSKNFTAFYQDQIKEANTILLSRCQLLEERPLQEIIQRIRDLNRKAPIIAKPWATLNCKEIFEGKPFLKTWKDLLKDMPTPELPFEIWGMETEKTYSYQRLEEIIRALDDRDSFGSIVRAKGILKGEDRWLQFNYSGGEKRIAPFEKSLGGRVCVIGADLKKGPLASLFL